MSVHEAAGRRPASARSVLASFFVLLGIIILTCALMGRMGAYPSARFGHDVVAMMATAWRLWNGQRPHTDFELILGSVPFLLVVAGFALTGVKVGAIAFAQGSCGAVCAVWCWALIVRRTNPWLAMAAATGCLLMATGTYHLGFDITTTTHANFYNRTSYSLQAVLVFELFMPREPHGRGDRFSGLSTGFLVTLLVFSKITFGATGASLVFVSLILNRRSGLWLRWALGSMGFATTAFLIYLGGLSGFFNDMTTVFYARSSGVLSTSLISAKLSLTAVPIALMLMVILALVLDTNGNGRARLASVLGIASCSFVALFNHLTNYGFNEIPGLWVLPLAFAPCLKDSARRSLVLFSVAGAVLTGSFYAKQAVSLVYAFSWKEFGQLPPPPSSSVFSDLYTVKADGVCNESYAVKIDEGVALVRAHSSDEESLVALNFEDPLTIGTGRRPATGDAAWWHHGFTFSGDRHPEPSRVFGRATLVVLPKCADPEASGPLLEIFSEYLGTWYVPVAESPQWLLLRRRGLEAPIPDRAAP